MLATNHALTGMLMAAAIPQPAIAWPLAYASHYALDKIPHFGNHPRIALGEKNFYKLAAVDVSVMGLAWLGVLWLFPDRWLVITGALIFAILPDVMYNLSYLAKRWPLKRLQEWHVRIQNESPAGLLTELFWAVALVSLLLLARLYIR